MRMRMQIHTTLATCASVVFEFKISMIFLAHSRSACRDRPCVMDAAEVGAQAATCITSSPSRHHSTSYLTIAKESTIQHNSILRTSKLTPRSLRLNRQTLPQPLNSHRHFYIPILNLHISPRTPSTLTTHNNNHVFPPRNLPPPIPGHRHPRPPHPTRRLLPHPPQPRHIRLRLRQG